MRCPYPSTYPSTPGCSWTWPWSCLKMWSWSQNRINRKNVKYVTLCGFSRCPRLESQSRSSFINFQCILYHWERVLQEFFLLFSTRYWPYDPGSTQTTWDLPIRPGIYPDDPGIDPDDPGIDPDDPGCTRCSTMIDPLTYYIVSIYLYISKYLYRWWSSLLYFFSL